MLCGLRFGSLMNIDKLILDMFPEMIDAGFGSLMNIDKLIPMPEEYASLVVLVL